MKDLFVELARLNGQLGAATALAIALRDEMRHNSNREAALETSLADELSRLSANTRQLVLEIREHQVGVNFTSEELDGAARPKPRKTARAAKRG
jgi:hypothetical protein